MDGGHVIGHAIRDGHPAPTRQDRTRVPVVIIGAGVAGLAAAWRLQRHGFDEFVVLELESDAGGNSRSGRNEVTAYPWGAHYVPVPERRIPLVEELFTDLGVLVDGEWDPRHLGRAPLARLFIRGEWIPGLEPRMAAPATERDQFDRFWDRMDYYRKGGDFTIPVGLPSATLGLDRISMKTWMVDQGFFSERLRWYVDYACRDDYGCSYDQASAWAGIHYFAARAEDDSRILTWPEGNGWVTNRLSAAARPHLHTSAAVLQVQQNGRILNVVTDRVTFECQAVVFAAPTFLAPYLVPHLADSLPPLGGFIYSPWYTANLVIDQEPAANGVPPAWENVIYDSPGLGYVVATHQSDPGSAAPTVWTYYRALADQDHRVARQALLAGDWNTRKEEILDDIATAHPDIRDCVSRLEVMRFGHGMIRPVRDFLSSAARQRVCALEGPVHFANSDLSGISIFEEALYRGTRAAERALLQLGYRNLDYAIP